MGQLLLNQSRPAVVRHGMKIPVSLHGHEYARRIPYGLYGQKLGIVPDVLRPCRLFWLSGRQHEAFPNFQNGGSEFGEQIVEKTIRGQINGKRGLWKTLDTSRRDRSGEK